MLVTWPFVMLLLDYWPLRRFEPETPNHRLSTIARLLWEKLPFFVLAALGSAATFLVQQHGGAITAAEHLPFRARLGNALISYGAVIWGSCSGQRIWRFSIRTLGTGRWARCCWREGCS